MQMSEDHKIVEVPHLEDQTSRQSPEKNTSAQKKEKLAAASTQQPAEQKSTESPGKKKKSKKKKAQDQTEVVEEQPNPTQEPEAKTVEIQEDDEWTVVAPKRK